MFHNTCNNPVDDHYYFNHIFSLSYLISLLLCILTFQAHLVMLFSSCAYTPLLRDLLYNFILLSTYTFLIRTMTITSNIMVSFYDDNKEEVSLNNNENI